MVEKEMGALALPMRKRWVACVAAVLLAASLGLAGCAQQEATSSASASSSAQQAASQEIGVAVVVMDPDNADVEAQNIPVTLQEGATVYDALEATGLPTKIEDSPYGKYMSELDGTAAEGSSGWVYTVNGEDILESIDACELANGDTVEFKYITL